MDTKPSPQFGILILVVKLLIMFPFEGGKVVHLNCIFCPYEALFFSFFFFVGVVTICTFYVEDSATFEPLLAD
jgi:hypothetical protein